jgi:molecular chaperone GrpE (heat shock protein)
VRSSRPPPEPDHGAAFSCWKTSRAKGHQSPAEVPQCSSAERAAAAEEIAELEALVEELQEEVSRLKAEASGARHPSQLEMRILFMAIK